MKLLIQNNRISGTATDAYTGPNEFIDAPADFDITRLGEYVLANDVVTLPPPPTFLQRQAAQLLQVDADVDALYGAVLGNRAAEYELAEREALAYAQTDYTGIAGSSVQSWATAKGWTAQQAADDIIAQAAQWRGAQAAIRAQRLLRKEQIRAAADGVALDATVAAWGAFLGGMRQALGVA